VTTSARRRTALAGCVAVLGAAGVWGGARASGDETIAPSAPAVVEHTFTSTAVRGTLRYRVYLPTGYRTSAARYPVVYLLGGLPSTGANFRDGRLRLLGTSAERAGHPAVVVSVQASRARDTDPEYHDWGPGRNWETAIGSELVRTIDANFRTIADRRARGLIGVSAGGYGAAIIAVHRWRTFSVAQAWSGYFHPTNPSGTARLSVGSAHADRLASVHHYVPWLARTRAVRLEFYVGDRDPDFVPDNRALHRQLSAAGVPHRFAIFHGGHTGKLWNSKTAVWTGRLVARLLAAR
jgi:enterochelin esterase-like enzyme